jgi:hypothetical protein
MRTQTSKLFRKPRRNMPRFDHAVSTYKPVHRLLSSLPRSNPNCLGVFAPVEAFEARVWLKGLRRYVPGRPEIGHDGTMDCEELRNSLFVGTSCVLFAHGHILSSGSSVPGISLARSRLPVTNPCLMSALAIYPEMEQPRYPCRANRMTALRRIDSAQTGNGGNRESDSGKDQ